MGALRCLIGEVGGTIKNTASTGFVGGCRVISWYVLGGYLKSGDPQMRQLRFGVMSRDMSSS